MARGVKGTGRYSKARQTDPREIEARFVIDDQGALTIHGGEFEWPLSVNDTLRLQAFLNRFHPAADEPRVQFIPASQLSAP